MFLLGLVRVLVGLVKRIGYGVICSYIGQWQFVMEYGWGLYIGFSGVFLIVEFNVYNCMYLG